MRTPPQTLNNNKPAFLGTTSVEVSEIGRCGHLKLGTSAALEWARALWRKLRYTLAPVSQSHERGATQQRHAGNGAYYFDDGALSRSRTPTVAALPSTRIDRKWDRERDLIARSPPLSTLMGVISEGDAKACHGSVIVSQCSPSETCRGCTMPTSETQCSALHMPASLAALSTIGPFVSEQTSGTATKGSRRVDWQTLRSGFARQHGSQMAGTNPPCRAKTALGGGWTLRDFVVVVEAVRCWSAVTNDAQQWAWGFSFRPLHSPHEGWDGARGARVSRPCTAVCEGPADREEGQ